MLRQLQYNYNRKVLDDLEEGDLVEFPRGLYSHWGVYIGNGDIVHLAGDNDDGQIGSNSGHVFTVSGVQFDKARVKCDKFWDVVEDSQARKNNSKDEKCSPFLGHEIKRRALSRIGEVYYNMLWNNCEHFAAWCRNGIEWSQQADNFLKAAVVAGAAVVVGGFLGSLLFGGEKEED